MDNFTFHNPTKLIFGKNTIPEIGRVISAEKINKVLLLAGSGSIKKNGVYDQIVSSLNYHKVQFLEYWGVRPNPTLEHAELVTNFAAENSIQAIIAAGGGSVIDEAKAIAAGMFVDNIWDLYEGKIRARKAIPIFAILTLSATGSEMNSYSVLSNEVEKKKWSFGSPLVYPKVTILDPSVQVSLPMRQVANGGVDSLAHLMENYFMGFDAEVTFALSESLQRTVISQISKLMKHQDDYSARANFAWSSTLALNGITSVGMGGGEWTVHNIEHSLSVMRPDVAHGEGLSVLFPAWIKYVWESKPIHFLRWAKTVWQADSVDEAVEKMKMKFKEWGSPVTLSEIGFSEKDFSEIVRISSLTGRMGKIKVLSEMDLTEILKIAL